MAWPPSGVIYVGNGACGTRYNPTDWDTQIPGCGDVRVEGNYAQDLTIAAAERRDRDRRPDEANGSDALLGLISDQFVRVWHPVNQSGSIYSSCVESSSPDQHDRSTPRSWR